MTRFRTVLSLVLAASALTGASVLVPATASAAVVAAVQPTRVLDTRNGIGGTSGMVSPGAVVRVAIAPAASAGASAVVLNLTATNGDSAGWVKAWPCSDPAPETSVVNFPANRTAANAVILKYDSAGVCMSTSSPVHLVADLTGWFVGQSDFTGTVPGRLLDTRTSGDSLDADVERRVPVAGRAGISAQATFVALNLTVVGPGTAGWLVAYPCGQPSTSSTVTFSAFETVANLSLVGLGQGDVCVRASTAVALVVDAYGYSTGQGGLRVASPSRLLDTRNTSQWPTGAAESGDIINLRVAGRGGVPNDADSVVVTLTVIDPTTDGFVTAWPCDQPAPTTSTINTWPGARRSNLGLVKMAVTAGTICIRYQSSQYNARTNIVVDAVGWSSGGPARTAPTGVGTLTPAPEPPPVGLPPMGTVLWSEDFSSPTSMNRLIKHISFGDNVVNGAAMQTFNGDHDHNCGSPATGRRLVENYQVSTHFWYCAPGGDAAKGHFMTGINTEGYVIMAFAPAADNGTTARVFPATANQICWDQNITELGARKWTQLIVVNASRYAANGNRIDYINPEFNDNGGTGSRAAVRLAGDDFLLNNLRNTAHFFNGQTKTYSDWNGLHNITDKATRYTICVRDNGNGTVTRSQARPGGVVAVSTGPGRFPAGPRVFILEDDSYNPMKAFQDGQQQVVTDPFTWHWDNIRVSSS